VFASCACAPAPRPVEKEWVGVNDGTTNSSNAFSEKSSFEKLQTCLALRSSRQVPARIAQQLIELLGQFARQARVLGHFRRCGNEKVHHATDVADTDILGPDAVTPRTIVVVAEGDAYRRRLKAEFLVGSRFASAAAHQRPLKFKVLLPLG